MNVRRPAVSEQLSRILASPQFREAPRLQSLLQFVVSLALDGKSDQIKESTIGSEVFGRMDTTGDSLVRSAAGRLRARLEEYYNQTGASDPVVITIPRGSYAPVIRERAPVQDTSLPPAPSRTPSPPAA